MHKQAIKHKQAIIGGGYLFTENACFLHVFIDMNSIPRPQKIKKIINLSKGKLPWKNIRIFIYDTNHSYPAGDGGQG